MKRQLFKPDNKCKGSFAKFFKLITRQRKLLISVFILSLIISAIGIVGTLVFQFIIDDVILTTCTESVAGHVHEHDYTCEEDCNIEEEDSNDNESPIIGSISNLLINFYDLLNNPHFKQLDFICIAIILLYILQALIQFFRGYLLANMSKKIDIPLMLGYYNHVIELPMEFFGTRKTGEIISRFSDASNIRNAISGATLTLMIDLLMVIGGSIILVSISLTLFWIALAMIIIYAITVLIFKNPINNINHCIMENSSKVTSFLKESIDGIETIKSFNGEEQVKNQTESLFMNLLNSIFKGSIIFYMQDIIINTISLISYVIILWVGAYLVMNGTVTLGTLISFYFLLSYFMNPIKNLIELQPTIQTAVVAAERLNDILELQPEKGNIAYIDNDTEIYDFKKKIEFKNVNFRYGHRHLVLKNINLSIEPGQRVALVGESGCGKTTLAKLLMAFYPVESGNILIGSRNINDIPPKILRSKIAYISQNTFLFSDTIINNLLMANPSANENEIVHACQVSHANEFIDKTAFGYNTMLEECGNDLSEGQKQRLAIARALLKKPDILILDEATSHLDSITEKSIKKTLAKATSNMTCIIIAHRLSTIKNCDKIFVMDKGEIVEHGTHEELINNNGLYAKYWNEQ